MGSCLPGPQLLAMRGGRTAKIGSRRIRRRGAVLAAVFVAAGFSSRSYRLAICFSLKGELPWDCWNE